MPNLYPGVSPTVPVNPGVFAPTESLPLEMREARRWLLYKMIVSAQLTPSNDHNEGQNYCGTCSLSD